MLQIQNTSEVKIVADALSRLPLIGNQETSQTATYQNEKLSEINDIKEVLEDTFPINLNLIPEYKWTEPSLMDKYKDGPYYKGYFCG